MEREVGGGIWMGKTCKPKAFSFQCMTKFTTKKKKIYDSLVEWSFDRTLILLNHFSFVFLAPFLMDFPSLYLMTILEAEWKKSTVRMVFSPLVNL